MCILKQTRSGQLPESLRPFVVDRWNPVFHEGQASTATFKNGVGIGVFDRESQPLLSRMSTQHHHTWSSRDARSSRKWLIRNPSGADTHANEKDRNFFLKSSRHLELQADGGQAIEPALFRFGWTIFDNGLLVNQGLASHFTPSAHFL
jgi:hypothetical protein